MKKKKPAHLSFPYDHCPHSAPSDEIKNKNRGGDKMDSRLSLDRYSETSFLKKNDQKPEGERPVPERSRA